MTNMRLVSATEARAIIARAVIAADEAPTTLGEITLHPHQRTAAARIVSLIAARGGAVLAEHAGLGKTYIALAVAARLRQRLLICAPASLRDMWTRALSVCDLDAYFVSHEALSTGAEIRAMFGFVIVDEAHRLRTPSTKRYATLAASCHRAKVLLVTATPLQNKSADLAAQIALFAGRRTWRMSNEELAAFVVRGVDAADQLPAVNGPHCLTLETEDNCLDQLLALPAPIPARDEGVAATLTMYGLLHQWTSSRAALVAALRRSRGRTVALSAALHAGRTLTRRELSAWYGRDDTLQLAFPELISTGPDVGLNSAELLVQLDRHDAATEALLRTLARLPDPDDERADLLRRVRRKHPGRRIIAFCHYEQTVNALWSRLRNDAGVAALTAQGARVAGGRIPRIAVLDQFTPGGTAAAAMERIELLLTTDLLSEGLNLQQASVIVHLDLPWNPARLEQRVGRVRRIGAIHSDISVYMIAPPIAADRLLRLDERLRSKLRIAGRAVGVVGGILPSAVFATGGNASMAESRATIDRTLRDWCATSPARAAEGIAVATVASDRPGFLAAVRAGGNVALVAEFDGRLDTSDDAILTALACATGSEMIVDANAVDVALTRLEAWSAARRGASTVDFTTALTVRARRLALSRVADALSRAPRHRRAQLVPLAEAARCAATSELGEGAERVLETLVTAPLADEAWLQSIAAFGRLNARTSPGPVDTTSVVIAVILFQCPVLATDR